MTGYSGGDMHVPTSLVGEAVAHGPHVVPDGGPFAAADDANVLDRKYSEEKIFIGSVVPVLVHLEGLSRAGQRDQTKIAKEMLRGLVDLRLWRGLKGSDGREHTSRGKRARLVRGRQARAPRFFRKSAPDSAAGRSTRLARFVSGCQAARLPGSQAAAAPWRLRKRGLSVSRLFPSTFSPLVPPLGCAVCLARCLRGWSCEFAEGSRMQGATAGHSATRRSNLLHFGYRKPA